MKNIGLIQAVPVERDSTGCWWHPAMPDFDEGDGARFDRWLKEQMLETCHSALEFEDCDHPAYVKYFDEGDSDFSGWTPETPEGEGWFALCIADTEDGPAWCWARRTDFGLVLP